MDLKFRKVHVSSIQVNNTTQELKHVLDHVVQIQFLIADADLALITRPSVFNKQHPVDRLSTGLAGFVKVLLAGRALMCALNRVRNHLYCEDEI
ncbi:hypothetical protein J6590_001893 [Homalodisca vitripennis]|nr:hypothetical protein J6590_001893 [Homalodisca vitripennis]